MQRVIKHAYRDLVMLLARKKLMDDDDLIFFLTHEEIGALVRNADASLCETARARRALFPSCAGLSFDDISMGVPEPVEPDAGAVTLSEGCLRGVPVSAGQVTGKARVVGTIDEAGGILPGEFMVAAYTDVGWPPYFSIIAGLITEIGSVLSHGAVVACEYGIPAIVSVKGARSAIRTGDVISIDGTTGEVVLQT